MLNNILEIVFNLIIILFLKNILLFAFNVSRLNDIRKFVLHASKIKQASQ